MISYAQNHEDVVLSRVFAGQQSGFYIDVGAWHPTLDSVTKHFYDAGWRGINIEPAAAYQALLRDARPRDINLQMALAKSVGKATLHCVPGSGLSTLDATIARGLALVALECNPVEVEVSTLASVCQTHAMEVIDFLKVDVEGSEYDVICGADWKRYRPRVVVIEAVGPAGATFLLGDANPRELFQPSPSWEVWEPLLLAHDYLFCLDDGLNRFYIRSEDRQLAGRLRVPANVFDRFTPHQQILVEQELERTRDSLEQAERLLETDGAIVVPARDRHAPAAVQFHRMPVADDVEPWVAVSKTADDEVSVRLARGDFSLPPGQERLLRTLKPGDLVLDVGAHIGTFSLAAAARGLVVIAVEASPRNVLLLERGIEKNAFGARIRVVQGAASATPGRVRFLEAGPYGRVASSNDREGTVAVPAIVIDDLVRDLGVGAVAAVKLDIEGSEPMAIRGMAKLLSGPDAPLLLYESNGHALELFAATPRDLLLAVSNLGYTNYAIRPEGLRSVASETEQWDCVVDYLALPAPAGSRILGLAPEGTVERAVSEVEFFARHPNPHYRAHVARTICRSSAPFPGQEAAIARILAFLRDDPDPGVRAAARTRVCASEPRGR